MQKKIVFRGWFYFRQGWGTYFAFIFAAINTMVVTYYLAIEKAPFLKDIFPSFISYFVIIASIGVPLLVMIGYIHYKKSHAYASEADITVESNPYYFKLAPGITKDVLYPALLEILNSVTKLSNNQKLSEEEQERITSLNKKLNHLIDGGVIGKKDKSD